MIIAELSDELRVGGHAVDIRGTALDVIERMDLAAAVRERRTRIMTMSVVRGGGPRTYDVGVRSLHEKRGDREIEIMRDDLVRLLFDAVNDDVETVFGTTVTAIGRGGNGTVTVELTDGRDYDVDLVVGADGQHSAVRELIFGAEADITHSLGAYVSIYTVDNFLGLTDRAVLYNEPDRGVAMFSVRGNQRAKAVLLLRSGHLDIDMRDESAQRDLLRERFVSMGWQTPRILDALDGAYDFYFDEVAQVRLPAWSSGSAVLLGDAAFGPSPLSGQGTSLALIGAYLLAHEIGAARPGDIATAVQRWERGFRANVEANQRLATSGMAVLLPATRTRIMLRNQAIRVLPLITRLGLGFGGELERASRAVRLPAPGAS